MASAWCTSGIDEQRIDRLVVGLDRLPLTIETAAARLRSMTIDEPEGATETGASLRQMTHRSPAARHRSVDAVVDWSVSLLEPAQQRLFAGFSVFAGPVAASDAAAVLAPQETWSTAFGLTALAERSLLVADLGGAETKYSMLRTVRAVAEHRLEGCGEAPETHRRHAENVRDVLGQVDDLVRTTRELDGRARLEDIVDELRAAHRWARRADPGLASHLSASLFHAAHSGSPAALERLGAMARQIDVRHVLEMIHVPTLVLHRQGDRMIPIESGRYLAARIPDAKFVELEGVDHYGAAGDQDVWMDEVREFVTGARRRRNPDRVLATVLVTDLVDSTGQATRLGDARWRAVLDEHDSIARRLVTRHDGTLVKTTGDGVVSWFDGPARAIRCAVQLRDELRRRGLACRAGLHAGEIERREDDIAGIAVHIAARIEVKASPGEVLVSRTVKDLVVGSRMDFDDRGVHRLKGVDDDWQLLAVTGVPD